MAAPVARSGVIASLDDQPDHPRSSVNSSTCQQDEASVHYVPLLPRTSDSLLQQRNVPSANMRQRVRRACLECRTKKVKCDGAETCGRCITYKTNCEYVEFTGAAVKNINITDMR
jgi:hypothetical protein